MQAKGLVRRARERLDIFRACQERKHLDVFAEERRRLYDEVEHIAGTSVARRAQHVQ